MKNIFAFNSVSKSLSEGSIEPVIEIVGLVKPDEKGGILIDLAMKGHEWIPVVETDVHGEVEHISEKRLNEGTEGEVKHAVMRFRLRSDASKRLMWAVIRDTQRSLNSMRASYIAEKRSKGHTVLTGESLTDSDCTCNKGDKCCCPDGWSCCNGGGRCCCSSPK